MADSFEFKSPCNVFQFTDPEDNWETWNGLRGPAGPAGPPGAPGTSVQLRGPVPSTSDLPATAPSGELWLVGSATPYDGWFYNGTSWQDAGQIAVGPAGPAGTDGSDGTTFTPSVSAAGVISWTNDGGKANPDPVNIKGPQGDPGSAGAPGAPGSDGTTFTPSVSAAGVISWTNDGGKTNPDPVNIKGPQGEPGSAGAPGAAGNDGTTFTPSVSAAGVISWTNDGGKTNPQPVNIKGPQGEQGSAGAPGQQGAPGPGVAAGGSAGQVLAKASGTDYDTEWTTPKSTGWKLLWTNPNSSSAFAAQTVSLNLSQYSEICIEFRHFKDAENFYTPAIQFVGYTGFLSSFGNATSSGVAMQYHQRRYAINANGVTFDKNTSKAFAGTAAATTENNNNIPVYIYAR